MAGAIAAIQSSIPPEWLTPLGDAFLVGYGIRDLDPPATLTAFSDAIAHDATTYGLSQADPPATEPVIEPKQEDAQRTERRLGPK